MKTKKTTTRKVSQTRVLFAAIIGLAIWFTVKNLARFIAKSTRNESATNVAKVDQNRLSPLRVEYEKWERECPEDSWMMLGNESEAQARIITRAMRQKIIDASVKYQSSIGGTLGEKIRNLVADCGTGYFNSEVSGVSRTWNVWVFRETSPIVGYYPKSIAGSLLRSYGAYFTHQVDNGGQITVPLLEMPDHVFAGFALHEFGHACRANERGNTVLGIDSLERIKEEDEMHELTHRIILADFPFYRDELNRIVKQKSAKSILELVNSITSDDLKVLAQASGVPSPSKTLALHMVSTYCNSLGYVWCDLNNYKLRWHVFRDVDKVMRIQR